MLLLNPSGTTPTGVLAYCCGPPAAWLNHIRSSLKNTRTSIFPKHRSRFFGVSENKIANGRSSGNGLRGHYSPDVGMASLFSQQRRLVA
jgi:hypothetical protein